MHGARGFLKREGFVFDKKPQQLNNAFLKLFSMDEQIEIEAIWLGIHTMGTSSTALYSVPKTLKQAHTLMSIDTPRYISGMEWIGNQVERLRPSSIVEVGCGTGVLLRYIVENLPDVSAHGIDASINLIEAAPRSENPTLLHGDYLTATPTARADLVICNFGFDSDQFAGTTSAHSTAVVGGTKYCPGCSDDLAKELDQYVRAWKGWAQDDGHLLVVGRIRHFGELRAFAKAAHAHGWSIDVPNSKVLRVLELDGDVEFYPAITFRPSSETPLEEDIREIEQFYRRATSQ